MVLEYILEYLEKNNRNLVLDPPKERSLGEGEELSGNDEMNEKTQRAYKALMNTRIARLLYSWCLTDNECQSVFYDVTLDDSLDKDTTSEDIEALWEELLFEQRGKHMSIGDKAHGTAVAFYSFNDMYAVSVKTDDQITTVFGNLLTKDFDRLEKLLGTTVRVTKDKNNVLQFA